MSLSVAAPAHVRRTYENFLKAVGELLTGELSTEELHQSASIVFDSLCDLDVSDNDWNSRSLVAQKRYAHLSLGAAVHFKIRRQRHGTLDWLTFNHKISRDGILDFNFYPKISRQ